MEHVTDHQVQKAPELRNDVADALRRTDLQTMTAEANAVITVVLDFLIEQAVQPDYCNSELEEWLMGWKEAIAQ